jgi:HEAT repeat protein/TolA-binding protein
MLRFKKFGYAAFIMAIAAAASASAQAQEKPQPAPEPKPAPFVFAEPDMKFDLDVEALQAQIAAMKASQFDKMDEKMFAFAEKAAADGERIAAEVNAKLLAQRGRGPLVVIAGKGDTNEDRVYQAGVRALDSARWDEAVMQFQRVIQLGGSRVDAATYWAAWSLNKQGNGTGALESLAKLRQSFPTSKWLPEGRALEVEIRQAAGQPLSPERVPDDELKLMALNNVMRADEQKAIPAIDKILRGTGSPRLKERALFVLAQNNTAPARQIVIDIAKGAGNPDLQAKAITYLGALGGVEARQALPEIYKASTSVDVKRSILRAFMQAGDRARLLDVAKTETSPDLRAEAVQQLGAMGAQEELSQLYQSETSPDVRKRIIQSMFTGHNEAKLIQLLRAETDEDLKRSIVQNLGMMASPTSADALTAVYTADKNDAVRRAVIDAFGQQRNSKALIDLAKKETDPAMKKRIVERLSNMKSTEATDYFLELLSKP